MKPCDCKMCLENEVLVQKRLARLERYKDEQRLITEGRCQCKVFTDMRRWQAKLCFDEESSKMFEEIMTQLESASTDAGHARAVLEGSWPQSEEILTEALKRVKEKSQVPN